MNSLTTLLVLGGARSGKSHHAQARAEAESGDLIYIATAEPLDDEMSDRIARHRADRGPRWRTIETPLDLAGTIATEARPGAVLLVDCLTLWTSNLLFADRDVASENTGSVGRSNRAVQDGYFGVDPSVEKYVDPADFFFVGAFKDDLSGDIVRN